MGFYVVPYRVLFHDTMAYGTHHFLTNFKFQCIARESLFFKYIVDVSDAGQKAHQDLVLLTREGYARNLAPVEVGKQVAVFISAEAQSPSSVRFCFRVVDSQGKPITCGYQTIVTVSASDNQVVPAPAALTDILESIRESMDPEFQNQVHAGKTRKIFDDALCQLGKSVALGHSPEGFYPYPTTHLEPRFKPKDEGWLLPGQGSFDQDLLKHLLQQDGEGEALFKMADALAQHYLQTSLEPLLDSGTPLDPELLQVGIYLSAVLCGKALLQQGNIPGVLIGHSAGELAALNLAGVLSEQDGIKAVCFRILALREVGVYQGGMRSVSCSAGEAQVLLNQLPGSDLELAVINHPLRVVVAGPLGSLPKLDALAKLRNIAVREIDSPYPFHTQCLKPCVPVFEDALLSLVFHPPVHPIFSPMERRFLTETENWPHLLASQFVNRLDFHAACNQLRDMGLARYIHCGPNQAMLGLLRRPGDMPEQFKAPFAGIPSKSTRQAAPSRVSQVTASLNSDSKVKKTQDPIAIVAMGCVLPGGHNPQALWERMLTGSPALSHLDRDAPELGRAFMQPGSPAPDKTYTLLGGYVRDYQPVDSSFGLTEGTLASWSKAQRFLAGAVQQCKTELLRQPRNQKTAFFLGATADGIAEYDEALVLEAMLHQLEHEEGERFREAFETMMGRSYPEGAFAPESAYRQVVQHIWQPNVPVLNLDAACASSMYAIIMGIQALRNRTLDLAFCGGVFAPGPANSCLFSQFGGLSAQGSRPFDAQADGVVFGEGAALVGLKRLDQAIRDGDTIHGVLRGYGMSSDGKSASVALPKRKGQVLAMERAYASSGIDKRSIQVVEAHATATPVGDAVEVSALGEAFEPHPCHHARYLGSVKAVLGHTGWAAGAASVIKMALALKQKTILHQPSYQAPNPKMTLDKHGFVIPLKNQAWPENGSAPRRCAINGFGFGGTNAHLILEAFVPTYHAQLKLYSQPSDSELVVVASAARFSFEGTDAKEKASGRFSPSSLKLPAELLVLPDALDEMDRTQKLATLCAAEALKRLPHLDLETRQQTAIVLGLDGRCERGEWVNQRLFRDRVANGLKPANAELKASWQLLEAHIATIPASNAYTLPGLMPNVASGRVANLLDCNGPNLVLSQPRASLAASIGWACQLLQSQECDLALAGGVAQPITSRRHSGPNPRAEAGMILALSRRRFAEEKGWPVLGTLKLSATSEAVGVNPTGLEPYDLGGAQGAHLLHQAIQEGKPTLLTWPEATYSLEFQPHTLSTKKHPEPTWPMMSRLQLCPKKHPSSAFQMEGAWLVLASEATQERIAPLLQKEPGRFHYLSTNDFLHDTENFRKELGKTSPNRFSGVLVLHDLAEGSVATLTMTNSQRVLTLCFLAAQALVEPLQTGHCAIALLLFENREEPSPASGLFSGFAKALAREFPLAQIKSILTDADDLSGKAQMLHLKTALATPPGSEHVDWVFQNGTPFQWTAVAMERSQAAPGLNLNETSLVVASGGGRGVTAVLLKALLAQYRCQVILLGRTDPKILPEELRSLNDASFEAYEPTFYQKVLAEEPRIHPAAMRKRFDAYRKAREVLSNLEEMQKTATRVQYLVCDLTDSDSVSSQLAILNPASKPALVIHGAGVQFSQNLARKSLADFQNTVKTKINGLASMLTAIETRWPGAMPEVHLLTSAFSFFGNDGQPDYGAANEALNRLAHFRNGSSQRWSSLAWLGWDGIGMTRGSEYRTLMAERNLHAVTAAEGAEAFLQVLSDSQGGAFCQIGDGELTQFKPPFTFAKRKAPLSDALDKKPVGRTFSHVFSFNLADQPYLEEHLVDGRPTLPGAIFVQLCMEAAAKGGMGVGVSGMSNLSFSRFAKLRSDMPLHLKAQLASTCQTGGEVTAELVSDFYHANGTLLQANLTHFQCTLHYQPQDTPAQPPTLPRQPGTPLADPYVHGGGPIQLSGPFDALAAIEQHPQLLVGAFQWPQGPSAETAWDRRVLLLDGLFRLAMMAPSADGKFPLFVPFACERIVFHKPIQTNDPRPVLLAAPIPRVGDTEGWNTGVWALDADGEPLLSLWGMRALLRAESATGVATTQSTHSEAKA